VKRLQSATGSVRPLPKHEELYLKRRSHEKNAFAKSEVLSEFVCSAIPKINQNSIAMLERSALPKDFLQRQLVKSMVSGNRLAQLRQQHQLSFQPSFVAKFRGDLAVIL
jgi:hypothetical protein